MDPDDLDTSVSSYLTRDLREKYFELFHSFLRQSSDEFEAPPPLSPGYLRWGRWEGCIFVRANARYWSERYRCSKNGEHACSADNRKSAVCNIRHWEPQELDNELGRSNLPSMFRYFTAENASDAMDGPVDVTLAGGSSKSMDFIPVRNIATKHPFILKK